MPQRRPHQKSRYGCDQCRKRCVKCDEKAPCYTNCSTRSEECRFSRQLSYQSDRSSVDKSLSTPPFDLVSVSRTDVDGTDASMPSTSSFTKPIGISDVALMHHWCTRTCYSFTSHKAELFRDHAGQEALQHDYIFEALLAITLLHMASEMDDPTGITARPLISAAFQHQDKSVSGFRAALGRIPSSNCDSIFACSVLIMVCSIVSPRLSGGCNNQARYTAGAMLLLANLIKGTSSWRQYDGFRLKNYDN